jgi:hypothetical protein
LGGVCVKKLIIYSEIEQLDLVAISSILLLFRAWYLNLVGRQKGKVTAGVHCHLLADGVELIRGIMFGRSQL